MKACVVAASGKMGEAVRRALDTEPELELFSAYEAPGHPQCGAISLPHCAVVATA